MVLGLRRLRGYAQIHIFYCTWWTGDCGYHRRWLAHAVTAAASLGFLLFGYDQGASKFPNIHYVLSSSLQEFYPAFSSSIASIINSSSWRQMECRKQERWRILLAYTRCVHPRRPSFFIIDWDIDRGQLGCMFGAISILVYGERLGRRFSIILGSCILVREQI